MFDRQLKQCNADTPFTPSLSTKSLSQEFRCVVIPLYQCHFQLIHSICPVASLLFHPVDSNFQHYNSQGVMYSGSCFGSDTNGFLSHRVGELSLHIWQRFIALCTLIIFGRSVIETILPLRTMFKSILLRGRTSSLHLQGCE